ncbi:hypothetical protein GIB67_026591 [Kingdonia uniflora]|uniref:glutathione transferase n=1 Tax=Kingdonia uniflora TaxID=39325 RepID=A0A7J7NNE0_9MAGN|nr:hypothetical protein GIB67_026591 [Kingdonia uniflora]
MASNELVLLDHWVSPFAMRVRITLDEKGLPDESKHQNLQEKSPLLLQMNPIHKQVPVLIHNGKPINESLVVVQYIDEVWYDRSPLLPSDPYQRASMRFWADYVDKKIYDTGKKIIVGKGEEVETAKHELIASLRTLELELGEKPYFAGHTFGYVDVSLIPFYSWFYLYEKIGKFNVELECPKLVKWAKRCILKESIFKNLPDQLKVYDYIVELKNAGKYK